MASTHWTVFITNAPAESLSPPEALTLARARWQIETLFKLWKSQARSTNGAAQTPGAYRPLRAPARSGNRGGGFPKTLAGGPRRRCN